jgi:hypothetical protein
MKQAYQQFAGESAHVLNQGEWGQISQLGNWTFAELNALDHYYDRVYLSVALNPDCFTGRKATVPPATLNYTSASSHGFAYQLTGTLKTATLRTVSTSAAADWQLYD